VATNQYFKNKVRSEQQLYEDIIIEALQMYGQDVYYLPREIKNLDKNRPLRLSLSGVFSELPVPPFVVKEWRSIN